MKKIIKITFICVISFIFINTNASTKTFTRTNEKPLVPSWITVDSSNKEAIMSTPAVDATEKIYDYAELLTEKEENDLLKKINEYVEHTGDDLVFRTAKDLGKKDATNYMYNFYDYNNFKRNGTLFFVNPTPNGISTYMITSGEEAAQLYTQDRINKTLRHLYPAFKGGDTYKGAEVYVKICAGFYNVNRGNNARIDASGNVVKTIPWIELVVIAIASTFVIMFILIKKNKNILVTPERSNYLNTASMVINRDSDVLIDKDISKEFKK